VKTLLPYEIRFDEHLLSPFLLYLCLALFGNETTSESGLQDSENGG
jgi:hypothetical protein